MDIFKTSNMTLPKEGPRSVPFNIDMAVNTSYDIDLTELVNNGFISFISGVWIDNSQNNQEISIESNGTYQVVRFPAGKQGWLQLLSVNPPKFRVSQSALGDLVQMQFVNFPVFPYIIDNGSGGGGDTAINIAEIGGSAVAGPNLPVEIIAPSPVPVETAQVNITDYSLALNGADQTPIAAGQAGNYLVIQNPAGNANVKVNIAGSSSLVSGITLAGGGSLEIQNGVANAVHVSGTNGENLTIFAG